MYLSGGPSWRPATTAELMMRLPTRYLGSRNPARASRATFRRCGAAFRRPFWAKRGAMPEQRESCIRPRRGPRRCTVPSSARVPLRSCPGVRLRACIGQGPECANSARAVRCQLCTLRRTHVPRSQTRLSDRATRGTTVGVSRPTLAAISYGRWLESRCQVVMSFKVQNYWSEVHSAGVPPLRVGPVRASPRAHSRTPTRHAWAFEHFSHGSGSKFHRTNALRSTSTASATRSTLNQASRSESSGEEAMEWQARGRANAIAGARVLQGASA